jgi:hypothetical protein
MTRKNVSLFSRSQAPAWECIAIHSSCFDFINRRAVPALHFEEQKAYSLRLTA